MAQTNMQSGSSVPAGVAWWWDYRNMHIHTSLIFLSPGKGAKRKVNGTPSSGIGNCSSQRHKDRKRNALARLEVTVATIVVCKYRTKHRQDWTGLDWVNLSKRGGKDGVFRGLAGLLQG